MAIATETEVPPLICPYEGCSVAEIGGIVICGTHGWSFRHAAFMAAEAAREEQELAPVISLPVRRQEVAA